MKERAIVLFYIWFNRIFFFVFGTISLFFGLIALPATPLALIALPAGLFALRVVVRIALPTGYRPDAIEYKALFGKGTIPFDAIRHARIWQASYTNMTDKNVILTLPGFLNFHYLLSTNENKLVKELNAHGVKKRSMFFLSEVHRE